MYRNLYQPETTKQVIKKITFQLRLQYILRLETISLVSPLTRLMISFRWWDGVIESESCSWRLGLPLAIGILDHRSWWWCCSSLHLADAVLSGNPLPGHEPAEASGQSKKWKYTKHILKKKHTKTIGNDQKGVWIKQFKLLLHISSKSVKACCHWPPFSHEVIAMLKLTTSGWSFSRPIRSNIPRLCRHSPFNWKDAMVELKLTKSGWKDIADLWHSILCNKLIASFQRPDRWHELIAALKLMTFWESLNSGIALQGSFLRFFNARPDCWFQNSKTMGYR